MWLGAAWSVGVAVTTDPSDAGAVDLVVCGPEGVSTYAERAVDVPAVALSLRPLGARFAEALPTGVVDYGAVVLAQPDAFTPLDPVEPTDGAWRADGRATAQQELLAQAADAALVEEGGRLLTDLNPCSREGVATLLSPLLRNGGTVWVASPDESRWEKRYDEERATAPVRAARSS